MKQEQKEQIQALLLDYIPKFDSQAKAFRTIQGASEALLIGMKKGNWANISDDMWRNVGAQLGYSTKGEWQTVRTNAFKSLCTLLSDAQSFGNVLSIVAPAGSGKTFTSKWYKSNNRNVYHIVCAEYYNRKVFLSKLLAQMGKDNTGTVAEMMDTVIETMMQSDRPLIILDEADKLSDTVLYFFITMYNMLQGKCGIVIMATDFLEKRITRGRRLKKKGYEEIFSRLGRKFIVLPSTTSEEVTAICEANGLYDPQAIARVYNEYEGDLRRVERLIHASRMKQEKETA